MLRSSFTENLIEAGCDEVGRGCLAGPVYAAAVIFPKGYKNEALNDSKKLSARERERLRTIIEHDAISWAVAWLDNQEIDQVNILNASIQAMHRALDQLSVRPQLILADGNRFRHYPGTPHQCIIKGDGLYLSIAAASILAKTNRDDYMVQLDKLYPQYRWKNNKGYPTQAHRTALAQFGLTPYHRLSFNCGLQTELFSGPPQTC